MEDRINNDSSFHLSMRCVVSQLQILWLGQLSKTGHSAQNPWPEHSECYGDLSTAILTF